MEKKEEFLQGDPVILYIALSTVSCKILHNSLKIWKENTVEIKYFCGNYLVSGCCDALLKEKKKSALSFWIFLNDLKYPDSRLALVNSCSIKCLELTTTKPCPSAFLFSCAWLSCSGSVLCSLPVSQ